MPQARQSTTEQDDCREIPARYGSRSSFIREALEAEIRRERIREDEVRHAQGYARKPGEFDVWFGEQDIISTEVVLNKGDGLPYLCGELRQPPDGSQEQYRRAQARPGSQIIHE